MSAIETIQSHGLFYDPCQFFYPPKTGADLRGLAAKGVVSAIHEFHSESVGLTGACPQPKRTVDPNASNLKYTLTLDSGGALTGQEYVVTY